MKKTEFLLRLKLQKGIGYVKLLKIAQQLTMKHLSLDGLVNLPLPTDLKAICLRAYQDRGLCRTISCLRRQCQIISFFDEVYPEKLRQIYQPPLILFAQGNLNLLRKRTMTIVGSRQATNYSKIVIKRLVNHLIKKGFVIASGLAKGVDGMAHRATLLQNGLTIGVVGNGLNYSYPAQNQILQKRITQRGLVLSEYLPDTPPRPFRFPQRNRILAGLCQGVIVTEAKKRSGSLITANLALQENRDVYAVPGPITSELSAGPNRLIEAGAIPLVDFSIQSERFDKEEKNILFSD